MIIIIHRGHNNFLHDDGVIEMRAIILSLIFIQAVAFIIPSAQIRSSARSRIPEAIILYASSTIQQSERNIVVLSHNVSQNVADGYFEVNNLLTGRIDVLARCITSALWVSNGIRKDTNIFLMLSPHNITIEVRGQDVIELNPDERTTALYLQRALLAGGSRDNEGVTTIDTDEQQKRKEGEIGRLQERNLERPKSVNPHKPGSLSKSERDKLRTARKAREAMVRRIQRFSGDSSPPQGFTIYRNDTLVDRLKKLKGGAIMLNEQGDPIGDVLLDIQQSNANSSKTINHAKDFESTTIILGDQIGYAACDEETLAKSEVVRQVSLGPLSLLTSQCITIMHHYLDTK